MALSLVLLVIMLVAVGPLFPDGVDASPLAVQALITGAALVVYALFLGAVSNSMGFVNATFILILEAQAAVAFLWHFDVIPSGGPDDGPASAVLGALFSVLSAPFSMALFTSTMYRSRLEWGWPSFGWETMNVESPYGAFRLRACAALVRVCACVLVRL